MLISVSKGAVPSYAVIQGPMLAMSGLRELTLKRRRPVMPTFLADQHYGKRLSMISQEIYEPLLLEQKVRWLWGNTSHSR